MLIRLYTNITRRFGIEPHEGRLFLLMGALVALLLGAYTIAKVLRDTLFLAEFGARALPYAYIGVALAASAFVWLEPRAAQLARMSTSRLNQYMAIALSAAAALAVTRESRWAAAFFYLWTGSQAMMLLPHFWVLALEVWDSRRARKLFPLLTGFGLIGGLLGGAFAGWAAPLLQPTGLMWILSALLLVAHALTRLVEARRKHSDGSLLERPPAGVSRLGIIRRSTYIKVLAAALALSVIISTLVDFQFKMFIQQHYPEPQSLAQFLGKFYVGLNALALAFHFGLSGWLLQRLGLGASTGLQPASVMLFATLSALSVGWWGVIALRWTQGVVFQTLGKSSAEIYFAAIRPRERRVIKPAIDTIVERWADAAVGGLLILGLHVLGFNITLIAVVTAVLGAIWLVVLLLLNHYYGLAFEQALSNRWLDSDVPAEVVRTPSARKALLQAMRVDDERRIVLALKLAEQSAGSQIAPAVTALLRHPSPVVRAAAIRTMEAKRTPDPENRIQGFLVEADDELRRAAVSYLLALSPDPAAVARPILGGADLALRQCLLDVLVERPSKAPEVLTPEWIEERLAAGTPEDLRVAAQALGAMAGSMPARRLRSLLQDPNVEIRRAALLSVARRPSRMLKDDVLPLLLQPEIHRAARIALAAIGDPAVPDLRRLLEQEEDPGRQALIASGLTAVGTPAAVRALVRLARSEDRRRRHLGLRCMARVRGAASSPALPRSLAHRMFLRELRDYRTMVEPVDRLAAHPAPEVRLLGESYRESAEATLERALLALASHYEPKPLFGAFQRLTSRDPERRAPALEYLGHVLPRKIFQLLSETFEGSTDDPTAKPDFASWIRTAWESDDDWLRACAVRASRHVPDVGLSFLDASEGAGPITRAEIEALAAC